MAERDHQHQTPALDGVYEHLADEIEGWADALGTDTTYTDPMLDESGANEWAASLRQSCDWALRTAESLLAVRGQSIQAEDLTRRTKALFDAAEGYEHRLDAMEDQCRVRIERITAQYRQAFGDDDPDAIRLARLCQGTGQLFLRRCNAELQVVAQVQFRSLLQLLPYRGETLGQFAIIGRSDREVDVFGRARVWSIPQFHREPTLENPRRIIEMEQARQQSFDQELDLNVLN